jgi:leucyl-tRNA synthetase
MSISRNNELIKVAKVRCRELRANQTLAESIFWKVVRNKNFFNLKFYRQYPIFYDLKGKETFFIVDFCCFEKKLVVEIDGEIHKYQIHDDIEKTELLKSLGYNVLRFKNEEIENNLREVISKIKIALKINER